MAHIRLLDCVCLSRLFADPVSCACNNQSLVDFVGWTNLFYLRNAIARERGIAAYRAWVPFERIRPVSIPQQKWEETFAWPANNKPPYPPLAQRILRGVISYVAVVLVAAVLLQLFTPFPVLTWLARTDKNIDRLNSATR